MGGTESLMETEEHLLVFGANGAIGGSIVRAAIGRGWKVTAVARSVREYLDGTVANLAIDPLSDAFEPEQLMPQTPYTGVCWAQGSNTNDSVYDFDLAKHREIYEANCTYILVTLRALLDGGYLARASRLCVISSIWQNLARQSKLSYCMSKAALQGLVLSASVDLAADGHLVNAVLPGALDTPMTRKNLSAEQIERLCDATVHHRLATLEDVASVACYLCSRENTALTGQFVEVDMGFSRVRIV
jgi:3-oxoacyl-[acyl-carrier protein] reductase